MKSKTEKQIERDLIKAARERVATLKGRSRRFILLLHRSKNKEEAWDQSDAPTSWLIYDIVRLEFGEAIAHKVANKNETK